MSIFNSALLITLIGMGLVFLALLLLWGLMDLMMRLTARMAAAETSEDEAGEAVAEGTQKAAPGGAPAALAAAAAVAVALALRPAGLNIENLDDDHISAWQTTMRAARLNQRAGQFYRKQRGGSR